MKKFLALIMLICLIFTLVGTVKLMGEDSTPVELIIMTICGCAATIICAITIDKMNKKEKAEQAQTEAIKQEEIRKKKEERAKTATGSCDVAGMWYHRSEINKVLTDGEYYGKCELEPDDEYPDSVKIFVDDHLIGYVPKRSRKNVRILLPYITKSTVELQKTREDGETIYSGTLHMEFPTEVLDMDILEKE